MEFQNFCLGVRMLVTENCSKDQAWMLFKNAVSADAVQGCLLHECTEPCKQGTVLTILVSGMEFANALHIYQGIITSTALLPHLVQEKPVLDLNECLELEGVTDLGPVQPDDGFCGAPYEKKVAKLVLLIDACGSEDTYRALLKDAADAVAASGSRIELQSFAIPYTGETMADAMFLLLEGHYEKKRITQEDGSTEQVLTRRLFDRSIVLSGSRETVSKELESFFRNGETRFVLGIPSQEGMAIPEQAHTVIFEDVSCGQKEQLSRAGFGRLFQDASAVLFLAAQGGSLRVDALKSLAEKARVPFFHTEQDCSGFLQSRQMKKALHVK